LGSSFSLRDPERKGYFSKCFAFYSRSLNRPFEVFSAWHLGDRQIFEGIFWFWSAPSCHSRCGFRSFELFLVGQQPRLFIRDVDSDPSNYSLWASSAVLLFEVWIPIIRIIPHGPAVPSCYSRCGLRSLGLFSMGQQRRLAIRVVDFDPSNYFPWASSAVPSFESWASVPRISSFRLAAPLAYLNSGSRSRGSLPSRL
jgi:hypothetical protein